MPWLLADFRVSLAQAKAAERAIRLKLAVLAEMRKSVAGPLSSWYSYVSTSIRVTSDDIEQLVAVASGTGTDFARISVPI